MKSTLKIYQAKRGAQKGKWRWRVVARNGKILADSGEGYVSQDKLLKAIELVLEALVDWEP